jgi:hypothetical protein
MLRILSDDTVRSFEPLQANFYGWIIVLSMLLVGVAGVGLTGGQIYKHMRFQNDLVRTGSTESGFGMAAAEN